METTVPLPPYRESAVGASSAGGTTAVREASQLDCCALRAGAAGVLLFLRFPPEQILP